MRATLQKGHSPKEVWGRPGVVRRVVRQVVQRLVVLEEHGVPYAGQWLYKEQQDQTVGGKRDCKISEGKEVETKQQVPVMYRDPNTGS